MVASVVPELVLEPPDRCEVVLPGQAEGEVETWAGNDGFEAYGYTGAGYFWASFPRIGTFRFLEDDSSVVAVPEPGASPALVRDAYHRNVLPLVLHLRGYEALHASAVGTPCSGLLALCGVSGTGKSTFAHALSGRGHAVWADDAVVLDLRGEETIVLRVPFRLRLDEAAAAFLTDPPTVDDSADETSTAPLRALAVLVPSESHDDLDVDISRLRPADAFTALLPHAYYFRLSEPRRNALMTDRYLRLAASIPVFEIRYRRGLDRLASVLDAVEERILAG